MIFHTAFVEKGTFPTRKEKSKPQDDIDCVGASRPAFYLGGFISDLRQDYKNGKLEQECGGAERPAILKLDGPHCLAVVINGLGGLERK